MVTRTEVRLRPIHPFPARMAAEVALEAASAFGPGTVVLDPMVGSGTVLRASGRLGHRTVGVDVDPLSVLMTRVWMTPLSAPQVVRWGERLVERALTYPDDIRLPWIDDDPETQRFIEYWFAQPQIAQLRKLAFGLRRTHGPVGDALKVALSRTIITKEAGVSLARDTSHSRPHRVLRTSDVSVVTRFRQSYERLARRLAEDPPPGNCDIRLGDARDLSFLGRHSVDAVVSSPPYLNAIDYLRGHRMALVWLGYTVGDLRSIRRQATGTERSASDDARLPSECDELFEPTAASLPARYSGILRRYLHDMWRVFREMKRVVKPDGQVVVVIGNSFVRGVLIRNDALLSRLAVHEGLRVQDVRRRQLPPSRRYLPPPSLSSQSALAERMRTEVVLSFKA